MSQPIIKSLKFKYSSLVSLGKTDYPLHRICEPFIFCLIIFGLGITEKKQIEEKVSFQY